MKLIGKKLYRTGPLKVYIRTGPLKLFNNKWGSEGYSSSTYSVSNNNRGGGSSGSSWQRRRQEAERLKAQQEAARQAQAQRERDARQAEVRRQEKLRQEAAARAKAKAEAEQQRKDKEALERVKRQQEEARKRAEEEAKERQRRDVEALERTRQQQEAARQRAQQEQQQQSSAQLQTQRAGFDEASKKSLEEQQAQEKQLEGQKKFFDQASKKSLQDYQDQLRQEEALEGLFQKASKKSLEEYKKQQKKEEAERGEQKKKFDLASKKSVEDYQEKQKQEEIERQARIEEFKKASEESLKEQQKQEEARTLARELERRRRDRELARAGDDQLTLERELKKREAAKDLFFEETDESKKRVDKLSEDYEKNVREKQALEDYEKGLIDDVEYAAFTGKKPKPTSVLNRRNLIKALSIIPKYGVPLWKIGEFINKKVSTPTGFSEAGESMAEESIKKEKKLQESEAPAPTTPPIRRGGGGGETVAPSVGIPEAKAPASTPAPAPEPAKEEDSIVKKEARLIRERALAQQLAAIRGLRGSSPGQKMRALQRTQDKFDREFAPQVQLALMKEREIKRKEALGISEAEKDRLHKENLAKLKAGISPSGASGSPNPWLTGLQTVASGLPLIQGIGEDLEWWGSEGGKVEGPGTETSDSIPARLSDGEFVVKASAVRGLGKAMGAKGKDAERKKGVDFLYKLQDKMDRVEKFSEGGEAYARPKKAFREAIGYEPESRFHDKALKDAKHGGARRRFRHYEEGGEVKFSPPTVLSAQSTPPSSGGYGSVVAAQGDLQRRIEELEKRMGR